MLTATIGRSKGLVHILEEYSRGYGMTLCGHNGQADLVQNAPTCETCQAIWVKRHPEEEHASSQ